MQTFGQADRFTQGELDAFLAAAPIDSEGNVDYKGIAYLMTHGEQEEGDAEAEE